LVGPLCIELFDEVVKAGLLLQEIGAGRLGGLQLECEMHSFVGPFCCGLPGLMRSMSMPSLSHQTANRDRLNKPLGLAKGTPLSVLIALGRPNSLKTLSNTVKA
jgi:hypothetical protein